MRTNAYGALRADKSLEPLVIERREPGPHDVQIDIAYCGVCHSDLHTVHSEWEGTLYPCVPGHEIVGHVSAVGHAVERFNLGDAAAVGCMIASCRRCRRCAEGLESYCENGFTATFNAPSAESPGHTLGGYSQRIVVDEKFVLRIRHPPEQLAAVAPLLCAGITTYSPLRHWKVGPGSKVGIIGIGGLGHMGIKLARALGAHVVALTTSERKRESARRLGAHEVIVSGSPQDMRSHVGTLDFILDTASGPHDLNAYAPLLELNGTLALVGAGQFQANVDLVGLVLKRRSLSGSFIGGIPETQELLDFCAAHGIVADVEVIAAQQINDAYERMQTGDVNYRFVIDIASLRT